jgi:hypothetical protein
VRGGFVFTDTISTASYVQGTDMFQNYAYKNTFPLSSSYDISLSTSVSANPIWFWIEKNQSGSFAPGESNNYNLRWGNNPISSSLSNPNPWVSFPTQNSNYIPVGLVDCYTSASSSQALIRQFLTTDVLSSGGGTIKISYFNDSASYTHNEDIVLVDPTHAPFSASMYPFSGSSTPNIGVGTYLCAIDVPFLVTSSSTNSGSRSPYNVYYPFWPPIPSGSLKLVNSTDQWSGSLANQNYWFPITPMSPLCIEGTTLFISYLDPSGSFNVNNLPYKS